MLRDKQLHTQIALKREYADRLTRPYGLYQLTKAHGSLYLNQRFTTQLPFPVKME
jgi:hypothetical protein